jgi:ATP-grasp domain
VRILILNRFALRFVPYRQYIDSAHQLTLMTSAGGVSKDPDQRDKELSGYDKVLVLDDYGESAHVELEANRLHRQRPFDAILAMSEFDLITAARLRRAWGIGGQTLESTLAYRDKLEMKRILAAAGIPVASFAAVDNATDLIGFIDRVGYPVVVKPRRGASSAGVRVLRTDDELSELLGPGSPLAGDTPAYMQAEAYIPHEMYNVDGLVVNGELRVCWPSMTTSGLGFLDGVGQVIAALEPGESWQNELVDLTRSVLQALPTPPTTLFHAEVFRTPDGDLLLNEIGCRIGGSRIWDEFRLAFDVDLIGSCIKGMYGGPGSDVRIANDKPAQQAGCVLVMTPPGKVVSVPEECPTPNVWIYDPYVGVGDVIGTPADAMDAVAAFVAHGETRAQVESTLQAASEWFQSSIGLEPTQ